MRCLRKKVDLSQNTVLFQHFSSYSDSLLGQSVFFLVTFRMTFGVFGCVVLSILRARPTVQNYLSDLPLCDALTWGFLADVSPVDARHGMDAHLEGGLGVAQKEVENGGKTPQGT